MPSVPIGTCTRSPAVPKCTVHRSESHAEVFGPVIGMASYLLIFLNEGGIRSAEEPAWGSFPPREVPVAIKRKVDRVIDVSGVLGPGPSLLTQGALRQLKAGEILEVISNDKRVEKALMELCGDDGCRLLEVLEESGLFHFVIRR